MLLSDRLDKANIIIGYLTQKLSGTDGLTADEWLEKAETVAKKYYPENDQSEKIADDQDEYWKARLPGTRG